MFELSSIPPNATLNTAKLLLHPEYVSQTTTVGAYYCPNNSWDENEIVWNNAPTFASNPTDTFTCTYAGEWYSCDFTSEVESSLNTGEITMVLRVENSGDSYSTRFPSRESEAHSGKSWRGQCIRPLNPTLLIDYTYVSES